MVLGGIAFASADKFWPPPPPLGPDVQRLAVAPNNGSAAA